jgi:hypothetical protein
MPCVRKEIAARLGSARNIFELFTEPNAWAAAAKPARLEDRSQATGRSTCKAAAWNSGDGGGNVDVPGELRALRRGDGS